MVCAPLSSIQIVYRQTFFLGEINFQLQLENRADRRISVPLLGRHSVGVWIGGVWNDHFPQSEKYFSGPKFSQKFLRFRRAMFVKCQAPNFENSEPEKRCKSTFHPFTRLPPYRDRSVGMSAENLQLRIQIHPWIPSNFHYTCRFWTRSEFILHP